MATGTTQNKVIYSDFLIDFDPHPVQGDLVRAVNETSVKMAIQNLIYTNRGERFFQARMGSSIKQYLFGNIDSQTAVSIEGAIKQTIKNFEPRARIVSVVVTPDYINQCYSCTLTFYIINNPDLSTLNITLDKLR